jgi:transcriptional regulator with XRE-family HTH domain
MGTGRPRSKAGRPRTKSTNILRLRELSKMTPEEAAEKLGLSISTLHRYENGIRKPSIESAQRMCNLYKCTLEDIFKSVETEGVCV